MKQKEDTDVKKVGFFRSVLTTPFKLFTALLLCMFLFFFVLMAFYFWGTHEVGQRLDYGYDATINPRLVQLEIGDKVFSIPQNHIWSRDRWKGIRC